MKMKFFAALCLAACFALPAVAAEKKKKAAKPRNPAQLTEAEQRMVEEGRRLLEQADRKKGQEPPKSLLDKMQNSGPNPNPKQ